jgi:membrane protein implicated in regulation of membrane protease activity
VSPHMLWLIAGVACLGAEAAGVTGVGLLFAGLGALTAGSIVTAQPELSLLHQWLCFLAATALWALFLWKPLQKWRSEGSKNGYKNIVGDVVYIGSNGLKKGETGEATWSGTIMRAELAEGIDMLPGGSQAIVTSVSGNTLIVKPK